MVSHPEKKDVENAPISDFYKELEEEAITHIND